MIKTLEGFKKFIVRGNVVDLAVGVVIGASFGTVVNTLVKGFLTPLIGAVAKVPDFSNLYFTLNGSKFMYGDFINAFISFLIVAFAVYFFVIVPMNALSSRMFHGRKSSATKICPECKSEVSFEAKRCKYCTQPIN